jgi:hypothetical protein
MILSMPFQQPFRQYLSTIPGGLRWDSPGINRKKISAGRKDIDSAASWRSGRPRRNEMSIKAVQHIFDFVIASRQPWDELITSKGGQLL